jgi:hypothetical protein
MKVIYTDKEKAIQKLTSVIAKYAWKIRGYQHYNIGYSPFHSELAKYLYKKGYRKMLRRVG